jgi:hypothetical protein
MKMHRYGLSSLALSAVAISVASLVATGPLSAQGLDNGFSLGLGGGFAKGFTSPLIHSTGGIGYYMQSTLDMPSPFRVLRPRADFVFADWGSQMMGLTGNLVFSPVSGKRVAPYLLAGAGAYTVEGARIKSGWNLGIGFRLPGEARSITIESRVHAFLRASPDPFPYDNGNRWRTVWAPIGLGIQF